MLGAGRLDAQIAPAGINAPGMDGICGARRCARLRRRCRWGRHLRRRSGRRCPRTRRAGGAGLGRDRRRRGCGFPCCRIARWFGARFRELALLGLGQTLVFLPFLLDCQFLVRRQFIDFFEILPCDPPFLLREAGPGAHLGLQTLLFVRRHARITSGDSNPFSAPEIRQRVEFLGQGSQNLLLLAIELRPFRRRFRCYGVGGTGKGKPNDYSEERFSHVSKP